MRGTWNKVGSILGIAAILFAQVAVAAHACSMTAESTVAEQHMADNPTLCQKHCEDGDQSLKQSSGSSLPGAFAPSFVVNVDAPALQLPRAVFSPADYVRSAPPPLTIRNCRFRN